MKKSTAGAAVMSLAVFGHGINGLYAICLQPCPHIRGSIMPRILSAGVACSLSAGQSQRRVARERRKLCGARLQPHQASASSVGLGSVLHRCASGASLIACPHMLLTVRCLHTWQDRPRDCVRATPQSWALCCQASRYAHEHVRLVRLHSRTEEHGRRGRARCVSASALNFTSFVRSRARM